MVQWSGDPLFDYSLRRFVSRSFVPTHCGKISSFANDHRICLCRPKQCDNPNTGFLIYHVIDHLNCWPEKVMMMTMMMMMMMTLRAARLTGAAAVKMMAAG